MLLKVLLLSRYPSLFYLESLTVLQLDLRLLELHLFDHYFEVVIDLAHNLDFALLYFVLELCTLLL